MQKESRLLISVQKQLKAIKKWFNGKTFDSGSENLGSIPLLSTNLKEM